MVSCMSSEKRYGWGILGPGRFAKQFAAELAEVEAPEGIDGLSFLTAILGKSEEQKKHSHLYWENPSGSGWQAIRKGKWKAHQKNTRRPSKTPIELYDLSVDAEAAVDVSAAFPAVVSSFAKLFTNARTAPEGKQDELYATFKPKKKRKK